MATNLFVGSLAYSVTDDELQQFFATAGNVVSAKVIMDRETNRSKGFGFVEMGDDREGQKAITALNGHQLDGRALTINEAKPKEDRGSGYRSNAGGQRQNSRW